MLFEQDIQDKLVLGKEKSTEAIREVTILAVRNFVAQCMLDLDLTGKLETQCSSTLTASVFTCSQFYEG